MVGGPFITLCVMSNYKLTAYTLQKLHVSAEVLCILLCIESCIFTFIDAVDKGLRV